MNILVCKINYLGDAVTFLPALKGLCDFFPEAEISVLCTPTGREIFKGTSDRLSFYLVDYNEVCSPKRAIPSLWKTAWALRHKKFSFSLHSYDAPSFSYLLAALLRIPQRIGFDSHIAKGQRFLSEKIAFDINRNVVDLNYDLIRHITEKWHLAPARVAIPYTPLDKEIVLERLSQMGLRAGAPFIAIHPGASLKYKEWDFNNFLKLSDNLRRSTGVPVLFLSEGNQLSANDATVISGLSIKQLSCLLGLATIFIGNNSGPMNIAASMGTPCVIILGPSPKNWEIYWQDRPHRLIKAHLPCVPCEQLTRKKGECLNKDSLHACMKAISVDLVEKAVLDLQEELRNE
jgi:ADP-heptose:LPS heptosyltransferase